MKKTSEPAFWQAFGLPEPRYADYDDPPEVDEDELLRLIRGYVSEERARQILELVYTYKNWREAYDRVVDVEADGA